MFLFFFPHQPFTLTRSTLLLNETLDLCCLACRGLPLNFSINVMFLQHPTAAQFLSEDYLRYVLVRDEN